MCERRYGRIVNTSSAAGLFGNFGQANYGAAKAGIAGLTKVLALEGAPHGIAVNAITPIAATRMTAGILGWADVLVERRCGREQWRRRQDNTAAPAHPDGPDMPDPRGWLASLGVKNEFRSKATDQQGHLSKVL
jgi:NAD(P)-dependent dehydrogenase (short-subunit alcohol dehydrogenase family)